MLSWVWENKKKKDGSFDVFVKQDVLRDVY